MKRLIGFVVLLCSACCSGQNLMVNGSLETGGDLPDGWSTLIPGSPVPVNYVYETNATDAPDGARYVAVQATEQLGPQTYPAHGWGCTSTPLQCNSRYRASYRYRRSVPEIIRQHFRPRYPGDGFQAVIEHPDLSDGADIGTVGAWTQYSHEFETPIPSSYNGTYWFSASTNPIIGGNAPMGSRVEYDDFNLELVERHTSASWYIRWNAGLYDFGNTDSYIYVRRYDDGGTITVQLFNGQPPGLNRKAMSKYWYISSPSHNALSASPWLMFNDAELDEVGASKYHLFLMRTDSSGNWVGASVQEQWDNGIFSAYQADLTGYWAIVVAAMSRFDYFKGYADGPTKIAAPGLLANDFRNGWPEAPVLFRQAKHGTVSVSSTGAIDYQPSMEPFHGLDEFWCYLPSSSYLVPSFIDRSVAFPYQRNKTAIATDDRLTVITNESRMVNAPGILANDANSDGRSLVASIVHGPQHGSVSLSADGALHYVPNPNYIGHDQFTYRATSAGDALGGEGSVEIQVVPVSAKAQPIAFDDVYTQGLEPTYHNVLENDAIENDVPLQAEILDWPTSGGLTFSRQEGSIQYEPYTAFTGYDSFRYRAVLGTQMSNVATVRFYVSTNTLNLSNVHEPWATYE